MSTVDLAGVLGVALREMGLSDKPAEFDSDIHSWRCSHPDIYGPCDCFREVAAHVAAAVTDWLTERLASEEVREAVVRAIYADGLDGAPEIATAALTAVTEALRGPS